MPADAADACGAAAATNAAASVIIDVNDFTTWTPDTWALLELDTVGVVLWPETGPFAFTPDQGPG